MIDCKHQWNWDKETRFCLKCRQVRTFPTNGEAGKVVWQGIDDKRNPTELTSEEKNIIAHLANELGLKKAVECLKIPMVILRAWQGSYLRKPKPPKSIEVDKGDRYVPLGTFTVEAANGLPPFPPFNDKWEAPVQLEWLVTYLELAKLSKEGA